MKMTWRPLFFVGYNLLCVGFLVALGPLAEHRGVEPFKEGGLVECFQATILMASAILATVAAVKLPRYRGVLIMIATCGAAGFIRELDSTFDRISETAGWQAPFAIVMLGGLSVLWRERKHLRTQLQEYVTSLPFAVMWFGLVITWAVAQLIGHGQFLKGVMEVYDRDLKRVFEESFEAFGYCILLIGVVETVLWARRRSKRTDTSPAGETARAGGEPGSA
jgi:uncharacterized membrane protein YkvI